MVAVKVCASFVPAWIAGNRIIGMPLNLKAAVLLMVSMFGCATAARPQNQAPMPSSAAFVFNGDASKLSSLQVDGAQIAIDQSSAGRPSLYPVPAGKREIRVSAQGAEDLSVTVDFAARQPTLLVAELVPNKDAVKAVRFPKALILRASRLNLNIPSPDFKSAQTYAVLLGSRPLEIGVRTGRSAMKKIQLTPGSPALLGEREVGIYLGDKSVASVDSADPGIYVVLLLPAGNGVVRALHLDYLAEDAENSDFAGLTPWQ